MGLHSNLQFINLRETTRAKINIGMYDLNQIVLERILIEHKHK